MVLPKPPGEADYLGLPTATAPERAATSDTPRTNPLGETGEESRLSPGPTLTTRESVHLASRTSTTSTTHGNLPWPYPATDFAATGGDVFLSHASLPCLLRKAGRNIVHDGIHW